MFSLCPSVEFPPLPHCLHPPAFLFAPLLGALQTSVLRGRHEFHLSSDLRLPEGRTSLFFLTPQQCGSGGLREWWGRRVQWAQERSQERDRQRRAAGAGRRGGQRRPRGRQARGLSWEDPHPHPEDHARVHQGLCDCKRGSCWESGLCSVPPPPCPKVVTPSPSQWVETGPCGQEGGPVSWTVMGEIGSRGRAVSGGQGKPRSQKNSSREKRGRRWSGGGQVAGP